MTQRNFIDPDQALWVRREDGEFAPEQDLNRAWTLEEVVDHTIAADFDVLEICRLNFKTGSIENITEDVMEEFIKAQLYKGWEPDDFRDWTIIDPELVKDIAREIYDAAGSDCGMSVEERNPSLARNSWNRA